MAELQWPLELWVIRHGESAGNVARDAAELAGLPLIDIQTRDADTPLSALGEQQSEALGRWFRRLPAERAPTAVLTSPYLRAAQTAAIVAEHAGIDLRSVRFLKDERLREKEFGVLDRLTKHGIHAKHPELAEQRALVGKFYFRPPGGESWADVILRLRSVLDTLSRDFRGERVVIIAHQVIVNCFRYLLEHLDEKQILDIDRAADVPNCSITSYVHALVEGKPMLQVEHVNFVAPLTQEDVAVSQEPDRPHGAR
jgi:broad specificity phosphatase PhoE